MQPIVKFVIAVILTGLLSFVGGLFLPWWCMALAALIVNLLIVQSPSLSFLSGFTALFLLWGGLAWYTSNANDHLLAGKVSVLVLKTSSPMLLILMTALTGALVAGLAALTGSYLYRAFYKEAKKQS